MRFNRSFVSGLALCIFSSAASAQATYPDRPIRLLGDPAYARGLARAAYATCDGCSWPSVRERWLDVYRDVVSARIGSGFKAFETTSTHDPA